MELSFNLDVISGDLNGFIFVGFEVYYHEYITNNVAIISLVFNKGIAIIGDVVAALTVSKTTTCNIVCMIYFSSEIFYLGTISNFVMLSLSIPIMFYMSYIKYIISNLQPIQHNLNNAQVQAVQHQVSYVPPNIQRRQSRR